MKKIQNKLGFAIVLAMGITVVVGLISILILDYIVPFSRNIKGVENSSNAYYYAYAGIEESLWKLSQAPLTNNFSGFITTSSTGTQYNLQSTTPIIPPVGDGNSEYDPDWNRLDQNTPIQLQLNTSSIDFTKTEFTFRIPDIDGDNDYTNNGNLSGTTNDPIINWGLTGLEGSTPVVLNASGSYITKGNVNDRTIVKIGNFAGLSLENQSCTLQSFYIQSCSGSGITSNHTLKLSLIDDLQLSDGRIIPYLEYQIKFKDNSNNSVLVPGRYSQIDTAGKSYGYKKTMDIKVPQLSTNQAFDFAVFQ